MVDLLCRGMPFGRVLIALSRKLRQIFMTGLQGVLKTDLTSRHVNAAQ
jgi:hypothetical protein